MKSASNRAPAVELLSRVAAIVGGMRLTIGVEYPRSGDCVAGSPHSLRRII
jgi:hypothetical protein